MAYTYNKYKNNFNKCKTVEEVHIELVKILCCDVLDENNCKKDFTRFKHNCRNYLDNPADRNLPTPTDYIDKLTDKTYADTGKPLLSPGNYTVLRRITRDIHADISDLIDEAERRIESLSPDASATENTIQAKIDVKSEAEDVIQKAQKIICSAFKPCEESYNDLDEIAFELTLFLYNFSPESFRYGKELILASVEEASEKYRVGEFEVFKERKLPLIKSILEKSAKRWSHALKIMHANLKCAKDGSVVLLIEFANAKDLEAFWMFYQIGEFQAALQQWFNSKDCLDLIGAEIIDISVEISEKDYQRCHLYLCNTKGQGNETAATDADDDVGEEIERKEKEVAEKPNLESKKDDSESNTKGQGNEKARTDTDDDVGEEIERKEEEVAEKPKLESKKDDPDEEKIQKVRETLLKYNHGATERIQVSPLEKLEKRLSIEKLYAPVVIRQDLEQQISMATKAEIEKANFSKFSHGIVGTGTAIAQDVLAKFIPCSDLQIEVRQNPLWNRLDKKQKALVQSAATEGYGNFDVTLIYTILRNVCVNFPAPSYKWGKTPRPNQTTPTDDIERIRELKNTYYSHLSKASLPEQEFRVGWQELKDVCSRMGTYLGKDYLSQLQKLEDFPEEKIQKLREKLLKYNYGATQRIQVSPLEKLGKRLPIDQLFAPVVIRQDLEQQVEEANGLNECEPEQKGTDRKQPKQGRKLVNIPDDMFYKDGELSKFVFMQGEAGFGKTTFCMQLVRHWCNAKQGEPSSKQLIDWDNGVGKFTFLFLITLRLVNKDRSSLLDMICNDTHNYSDECREAIRHVLTSGEHRSLVILDGLDEWKPNEKARGELKHPGIPNFKDLESCTFFIASRPWKFEVLADLIQFHDRVIEIEGLGEEGVRTVIRNVLVNYFKIDEKSEKYEQCYKEISQQLKAKKLKAIMQIPLLLIVSVILLYRKENVGNSMTTFYMALVRMLIEQTFEKKSLDPSVIEQFQKLELKELEIPPLLQNDYTLNDCFAVLYTLGEIAYQDLMSSETSLVFEMRELERKLSQIELEFALKVGLLSQCEAPSSYTRQVSVNFLHKSIEEFLGAMNISSRNEVHDIFCKHLSSIKVIMELSNVIMFTLGLFPSLGSVLSQQIVHVANTDPDICRYRDTFTGTGYSKVRLLYNLQVSCYREMKQGLSMLRSTEPLTYHISDVYLDEYSNIDTVRMSVDLMYNNPTYTVSLYLYRIPDDGEDGIIERELTHILDNTTSLQYLFIWWRTISTVSDRFTSLKTLYLRDVKVTREALWGLQRCLQYNTVLQSLTLRGITCQDNASLRGVLLCLPNSPCLSTLHIGELFNAEETQTLVNLLPKLKCLRSIQYDGTYPPRPDVAAVAHTVSCMKQLQHIVLEDIPLGDRSLKLTSEMSQLKKVELHCVNMSAGSWNKFVHSLINIPHHLDVILSWTDIDGGSVTMIRSSPYFTVTKDKGKSPVTGLYRRLEFSKVTLSGGRFSDTGQNYMKLDFS